MHPLHTQIFCLSLFFSAISLSGGKMSASQHLASHKDIRPPLKKRCLDIVSPQSSVKINQISLDESGEHVGICSEDGKVRSLRSSPPVTGPWACSAKKRTNQCFSSFIIHPQIRIKLILSVLNFMLMMWNLRCLAVNFQKAVLPQSEH